MAATKKDVERWIKTGREKGAAYIISVCDTFDYDDYPVYVMPDQDLDRLKKKYNGANMQRMNEVIDLRPVDPVTGLPIEK